MGLRVNRNLGKVECLQPGEYTTETASGNAAVCCPVCGGISDIDPATHRTELDGRVVPAWKCPTETCVLFDYLTLEARFEGVLR